MKKIVFSDRYGLTQAVLEGRKTMTRRILKVPIKDFNSVRIALLSEENKEVNKMAIIKKYAKYQVGDDVAVAQAYKEIDERGIVGFEDAFDIQPGMVSPIFAEQSAGWTNKMFVRTDLMPNQIRITNIKLERLQDISDEDCMKEGVEKWIDCYIVPGIMENQGKSNVCFDTPHAAFAALIERISGKGIWEQNPWVYAYEFVLL